ncbi:MAG: carbohydrate porin [Gemmatimonadota bacterium]
MIDAGPRLRALAACLLASVVVWPGAARAQTGGTSPGRRVPPLAQLSASYTADFVAVADAKETHGAVLGDGTAELRLNVVRADLPGTHVLLKVLSNHGGAPSNFLGDIQGVDNIEAPAAVHLYEAWIEHTFGRNDWSVLAGFYDLNSEFDAANTSSVFVNSSFGVGAGLGQSGRRGPSIFPTTSLGLRIRAAPTVHSYAELAVLDGVPGAVANGLPSAPLSRADGALLVAEAGYEGPGLSGVPATGPTPARPRRRRARRAAAALAGSKLALGAWVYTGWLPAPGAASGQPVVHGSFGAYAFDETWLYRRPFNPGQGLRAWLRLGMTAGRADPVRFFTGAALTYTGLLQPNDVAGLGVVSAVASAAYRDTLVRRLERPGHAETALELTWQLAIGERFFVQPDIQLVLDPLADPARRNGAFVGLRVGASL